MNENVADLSVRRGERIGEELEYASRFWVQHLCLVSMTEDGLQTVIVLLKTFMEENFIPWLEVLSICNELHAAVIALRDVKQWLANVSSSF